MLNAGHAGHAVLLKAQQSCMQYSSMHSLLDIAAALTLTEAERASEAKQLLNRRSRYLPDKAQICSDGFVIGLAFLLEVSCTPQSLPRLTSTALLLKMLACVPGKGAFRFTQIKW